MSSDALDLDNERLKPCKSCQRSISRSARTCPHCGQAYTSLGGIFFAVLLGLLLGGFFVLR